MCRWMAYSGSPVLIEDLLYTTENSLIVQSLHAQLGVEPTNGDGFGVGWYDDRPTPGLYRNTEPAWNDTNLREVSGHIRSPMVHGMRGAPCEIIVTNPPGTDPAPWEAAGATWCLTGFERTPREADVRAAIAAG